MDLAQLRIGSISYMPASSDVVFKMEVTGHGQEKTASESIRALKTGRPSPVASPEALPAGQIPAKGAPAVNTPQPNAASPNPAANVGNTPGAPGATGAPATPATANAEPPAPEETPKAPERIL